MNVPEGFARLRLPASGYLEATGPFYARRDAGRFVLGLRVEARHCNAAGACHGGMIATICDVLLTVGGNVQSGQSRFLPTISITCDYLAPAPAGAWLEGRLEVLRVTRGLMFAAGIVSGSGEELASGRLRARHCAVEDFELGPDDEPFDLVFAVRVGALDGRHPAAGERALTRIASATNTTARLFIDGGRPLREVHIPRSS